jgi:hypothetical protein
MSYNISINRVASEARAQLAQLVTDAMRTAPVEEHEQIKLAGQAMTFALDGIDDEHLVEAQAYGANVPSTGTRTFHINVQTRAIRTKPETAAAQAGPWDPTQGPLGALRPTPGNVDGSRAATSASSPAGTGDRSGTGRVTRSS